MLPGLPNLMPPLFGLPIFNPIPGGSPLVKPGDFLPNLLPKPQVQGDQNQVAPAGGGFGAGVSGNGFADIDNVNLDPAELRALDNLMQTYLADGKFTKEEQHTYQEIRSLFARGNQATPPTGGGTQPPVADCQPPATTTPTNPVGGGTQVPPTTPAPKDLWPTGDKNVNGRTFRSWGDPHEVSGDGGKFDNMQSGTFVKMKSASGDFEVQTTQGKDKSGRWPGATLNHKAAIKSGSDVVTYDGLSKSMTINGKNVPIPKEGQSVDLPGGGKVVGTKDGVQVQTAKGDKVNIHQQEHYIDISGEISANRKDGEVRGSLGNFDHDTNGANDLIGRNGQSYNMKNQKELDAFIEDWRVKPGEDLFAPKDPAGGGGANNFDAEFAALDKTGNGYLSGSEITPELKAAFPGKDRITKEDYVGWKSGKLEAEAKAKDEAEFAKRDINGDGQLDGNEIGDAAKYDKGGNWKRPDGSTQTEISKEEFLAGRAAERKVGANPPAGGGVNPPGGGVGDDKPKTEAPPAIQKARKAKRKKKKRGFFSKLKRSISKMAGKVFKVATNVAFAPLKLAVNTTQTALGVAGGLARGDVGGAVNAAVGGAFGAIKAVDPFDGVRL